MERIRVIVPESAEECARGDGEAVSACVCAAAKADCEAGARGRIYDAFLEKSPRGWPDLFEGALVPIELRGEGRHRWRGPPARDFVLVRTAVAA